MLPPTKNFNLLLAEIKALDYKNTELYVLKL